MLHVAASPADREQIRSVLLRSAPSILARVQAQVLNRYYEPVDSGDVELVDVTAHVLSLPMAQRLAIVDDSDSSDQLLAAAEGRQRTGPVSVRVAGAILEHALATDPVEALTTVASEAGTDVDRLHAEVAAAVRRGAELDALEDRTDRVWQDVLDEHEQLASERLTAARASGIEALVDVLLCVESPAEALSTIRGAR